MRRNAEARAMAVSAKRTSTFLFDDKAAKTYSGCWFALLGPGATVASSQPQIAHTPREYTIMPKMRRFRSTKRGNVEVLSWFGSVRPRNQNPEKRKASKEHYVVKWGNGFCGRRKPPRSVLIARPRCLGTHPSPHRGRFAASAAVETPNVPHTRQEKATVNHSERQSEMLGRVPGESSRQIHNRRAGRNARCAGDMSSVQTGFAGRGSG
jgi:hypothetical protein